MKAPSPHGAIVDRARITKWMQQFRFYRAPPGQAEIQAWLDRFKPADRDVAARILDCVEVISEASIQQGYKQALDSIDGWQRRADRREGKWVFTGFGGPSESGLAMLRVFREANNLTLQSFDGLFCNITDIPKKQLSAADTVVLVDDFSGTGRQIVNRWPTLTELIACDARCFLILTAATIDAIQNIEQVTTLQVLVQNRIQRNENIFSTACSRFSVADRNKLLPYCERADKKNPKGFGECGLLYVLSHKTPNNSIPVLHANHSRWVGLFPRNLQPAD
jgi:hypothetical protein